MRSGTREWAALLIVFYLNGCAVIESRSWNGCAIVGAVLGGAAGGVAGGVIANNVDHSDSSDGRRAGGIVGGIALGAPLGALAGHLICDPLVGPRPALVVAERPAAPPPPPPAPAPLPPSTKIATLRGPHFDFDKSEIRPEGRRLLDESVTILKEHPGVRVLVEGHTDSIGTNEYNQRLSERRAGAVRDYLATHGIESSRMDVRGESEGHPVASNKTDEGRAQNRRVEVIAE